MVVHDRIVDIKPLEICQGCSLKPTTARVLVSNSDTMKTNMFTPRFVIWCMDKPFKCMKHKCKAREVFKCNNVQFYKPETRLCNLVSNVGQNMHALC